MRVIVLGSDGYIGWPLVHYLAGRGMTVLGVDNGAKRQWEADIGVRPFSHGPRCYLHPEFLWGSVLDAPSLYRMFDTFQPDAVVHLAEQPSAPYSMVSRRRAEMTIHNNVVGTLNVIMAAARHGRKTGNPVHIVKLGSMGEYGTPNIPIEEGWLKVTHKGYTDRMLYPKKPGSFYHASKVADSTFLEMACRLWELPVTDLNQGVVWGHETEECPWSGQGARTSFHYDDVFGTVVNRFCAQAAIGAPLSVYGTGGQRRGFLHLTDSLQCIRLCLENPAAQGEFRVFNQLWETLSIMEIAMAVQAETGAEIEHLPNPRIEAEEHFYRVTAGGLQSLGFVGTSMTLERLGEIVCAIAGERDLAHHRPLIQRRPSVTWRL